MFLIARQGDRGGRPCQDPFPDLIFPHQGMCGWIIAPSRRGEEALAAGCRWSLAVVNAGRASMVGAPASVGGVITAGRAFPRGSHRSRMNPVKLINAGRWRSRSVRCPVLNGVSQIIPRRMIGGWVGPDAPSARISRGLVWLELNFLVGFHLVFPRSRKGTFFF